MHCGIRLNGGGEVEPKEPDDGQQKPGAENAGNPFRKRFFPEGAVPGRVACARGVRKRSPILRYPQLFFYPPS